jgi:protein associated with RNAse G/E
VSILSKNVVINSRKFDQSISRSWTADLIERQNSLLVFVGIFNETVKHPFLGVIRPGTISYEYYWLGGWFNVFRFHEPEGEFRNFYCNLNMPPVFQNNVLDYVDLDIDVIVWKDFSHEIHDLDDFIINSKKYKYSEQLVKTAEVQLNKLLEMIENRDFPFDISI